MWQSWFGFALNKDGSQLWLNAKNDKHSFGWQMPEKMDFSDYDKVNDFELNFILWHSVVGKDTSQLPAVRRAIAFRAIPQDEKLKK